MHFIVIGAGDVGIYMCQYLASQKHTVTLLEMDEAVFLEAKSFLDVRVVHGDGSKASVLQNVSVDTADAVISLTIDDKTNILVCSLAKALGAKKTIARIHDSTFLDNYHINYQLLFGIDVFLDPEKLCAVEIAKCLRHSSKVAIESFANGQIQMHHIMVSEHSCLVGEQVRDIAWGNDVRVAYIMEEGKIQIAHGAIRLKAGQEVTLVGTQETLISIEKELNPELIVHDQKNIVIYGGTETTIGLLRLLSGTRYTIRVIEKDTQWCEYWATQFLKVTFLSSKVDSIHLLEEEYVKDCDFFVACTKNDEINMMMTLQACTLGSKKSAVVINNPNYEALVSNLKNKLGIDTVVSPRLSTVNEIKHYVAEQSWTELDSLDQGSVKVLQVALSLDTSLSGKMIKDIVWPDNMLILAIIRKFKVIVAKGTDVLIPGDTMIIIVRHEMIDDMLKLLINN